MQIDFHHAVTYVCARLAGFDCADAAIIAHAAQYVDDATSRVPIRFSNDTVFEPIASAHDPFAIASGNGEEAWLPFHFLPGNEGQNTTGRDGGHRDRLVCRPDSKIARRVLALTGKSRDLPFALHHLGVALHVLADTFAHQGFAGVRHPVNEVEGLAERGDTGLFSEILNGGFWAVARTAIPPLGHGRAHHFPDLPFLEWQYVNGWGEKVLRNNVEIFADAADAMCRAMQDYLGRPVVGLSGGARATMETLFASFAMEGAGARHLLWQNAICDGAFPSLKGEWIDYGTGSVPGSWEFDAVGARGAFGEREWRDSFPESHWKCFHDAIRFHRDHLVKEILPACGIVFDGVSFCWHCKP